MNEKPKVGQIYEIFREEKTSSFIKIVKVIEKDDRVHYTRYIKQSRKILQRKIGGAVNEEEKKEIFYLLD